MSISRPSTFLRVSSERGFTGRVDRGSRVISGFSVITRGEALGHGAWADREFLSQVVVAGNDSPRGLKSRFTHPGLSGDGLGSTLGRAKNFRLSEDGSSVLADLHLLRAASRSPQGDLAGYVMDLAEEDPDAFGASVVFQRDPDAEEKFRADHVDNGRFVSPDEKNTAHLEHFRLSQLRAADLVDDPAANSGFFHEGEEAASRADAALSYVFGLTDKAPDVVVLGSHPDRAKNFMLTWLAQHDLEVVPATEAISAVADTSVSLTVDLSAGSMVGLETTPEESEEDMDLGELTLEQLREARPDLIEEIEKAVAAPARAEGHGAGVADGLQGERDRCVSLMEKSLEFSLPHVGLELLRAGVDERDAVDHLKDRKIEALQAAAPAPAGPDAPAVKPVPEAKKTPEQRWEESEELRAEFAGNKAAFLAYQKHKDRVTFNTPKKES